MAPGEGQGTLGHGASGSSMNFGQVLTLIQNMQNEAKEEIRAIRDELRKQEDRHKEELRTIRDDLQKQEDRGRGRARELHEKTDELGKHIFIKIGAVEKAYDEKCDAISEKVVGLESDKESFTIQIKDVKGRLDKVELAGDVKKRLDDLEESDKATDAIKTDVAKDIATVNTTVATVKTEVKGLKKAVETIQDNDPYKGAKFWQRPGYLAAMGTAIAGVITAIILALGAWKSDASDKDKDKDKTEKTSTKDPGSTKD